MKKKTTIARLSSTTSIVVDEATKRRNEELNNCPILHNGIKNSDIFRTMVFHFKTDNYLNIDDCMDFVVSLVKRPMNDKDEDIEMAEERFM